MATTTKRPLRRTVKESDEVTNAQTAENAVDAAPATRLDELTANMVVTPPAMPDIGGDSFDEPSDEILDAAMESGETLRMRPDLHGCYVQNTAAQRNLFTARGYKVAKKGAGWVLTEENYAVNDAGELEYGDCVIMVVTKAAYERYMARQKAKRRAAEEKDTGTLSLEKRKLSAASFGNDE